LVGIHPGGLLFTKCLVGIFCFQALPPSSALAAGDAHGYEDWSNTDVSHMWRPPQAKTARHHLASTPTGDATMSIPIVVPRSRFSPSLAIVYSGQGGNDRYFGEGWRLNLPVITREKKWVS
jgi:hypothetical protein